MNNRNYDKYKMHVLALQKGDDLFWNEDELINEEGSVVTVNTDMLNWNSIEALTLGKCGELYSQYVLNSFGFKTYESMVDDHGVDLLAKTDDFCSRIQVKTIRNNNYTFIKEGNPTIDANFFLLYIRVSNEGIPKAYLFPMNYIVRKLGNNEGEQFMCFVYHKYVGKKSDSEYGISAADKYFENNNAEVSNTAFYCIADGWTTNSDNLQKIIRLNKDYE